MAKEYIEREALIEEIRSLQVTVTGLRSGKGVLNQYARFYRDSVERAIVEAPAADVVEVVHGYWIDKPTGAYGRMQSWCSACGKHSGIGGIESNRHKPYCPNCGAKMDGERKEK